MRQPAVVLALLTLASCGRGIGSDPRAATDAIRAQLNKYLAAIDAGDSATGGEVWLNSPDVSFIWPLGHERGWDQVKKVYPFFGNNFSNRRLTARDVQVHASGDAAWVEFYWHFDAKQNSDGSTVATDGRESQVYRRVEDQWRLVHAHYSGLPPSPDPLN